MPARNCSTGIGRALVAGTVLGVGAYAAYVATTWTRYGHPRRAKDEAAADPELDRLMPDYDVVERHHIAVNAPASMTLEVAREMDLSQTTIAKVIFRARELVMNSQVEARPASKGLVADLQAMGWGVLSDIPGRELVMGGVTRPWEANPVFHAVPAEQFAGFAEPDYVKIAFTLRADEVSDSRSIFRTETRAVATDAGARRKFRTYWSLLSPGIIAIRLAMLRPLKFRAEHRARRAQRSPAEAFA